MILRPRADSDIDHQFEYLAIEAGVATARRFVGNLQKTLAALRQQPDLGSPRSFGDPRLEGIRVWPVRGFRRYLVFYIPTNDAIEVVRLLHGARDVAGLLGIDE